MTFCNTLATYLYTFEGSYALHYEHYYHVVNPVTDANGNIHGAIYWMLFKPSLLNYFCSHFYWATQWINDHAPYITVAEDEATKLSYHSWGILENSSPFENLGYQIVPYSFVHPLWHKFKDVLLTFKTITFKYVLSFGFVLLQVR